jgi:uncharacterized protein with PIN domain
VSSVQRFFTWLLPARWAADMEAQSRKWMMRCKECGHEQSVWEAGGVRWKAVGNPTKLAACPQCRRNTWHKVYCIDQEG